MARAAVARTAGIWPVNSRSSPASLSLGNLGTPAPSWGFLELELLVLVAPSSSRLPEGFRGFEAGFWSAGSESEDLFCSCKSFSPKLLMVAG